MELQSRKNIRLKSYDYNVPGYYFITVCTKQKQKLLCDIVGTGVLDGPKVQLSHCGKIAEAQLENMCSFYDGLRVEKYVIMPNHIHLLIHITSCCNEVPECISPRDSKISKFIGSFKRFTNKSIGENIWQSRSYDHVVRGERDYQEIWKYIDDNPSRWMEDRFYIE